MQRARTYEITLSLQKFTPELLEYVRGKIASTVSQGVRTIVIATKATTITQAVQYVWDFVDIGEDVEVNFNDRSSWVATVSAAARRQRLKRANNGDWNRNQAYFASEAAKQIVQTWQPDGWDRYSGPRDALINVLALAAYDGRDEYFDMIRDIFGEDALRVGHPSLDPVS